MTQDFTEILDWANGFISNQTPIGVNSRLKDSLMPGSFNTWIEGRSRFRSWDGLAFFNNFGNNTTHIVGGLLGTLQTGSIIMFLDGLYWLIGSGNANVGNSTTVTALGSLSGNRLNKLHYFNSKSLAAGGGGPIGPTPPSLLPAGISTPTSPPVIAVAPKVAGDGARLSGLVSVRVTYVSPVTGSESNGSPPSVAVNFDMDNVQITLPPTPPELLLGGGTPKVRLYATFRGFGAFGPWFYVGGSERDLQSPFTTTWSDGDLLRILAPIDHDPPRSATHCFSLGDIMILAGAGGRLQASKPGLPECYPPDFETNLDPQEDVLAIRGRPEDGWQYVCCRNSIHAVSLNEDELAPIIPRAIFGQVGIANKNAATQVSGQLYFYSSLKNASRTSGSKDPDSSFSVDVEDQMQDWNPSLVCVGYHQEEDAVFYFHRTTALVYKRKLGMWCAPFILDLEAGNTTEEDVSSCETINGQLIISVGSSDGGQLQYRVSGGTNPNMPWRAIPFWRDGEGGQNYDKTLHHSRFSYNVPQGQTVEAILRTNFDLATVRHTSGPLAGGPLSKYSKWQQFNVTDAKAFTVDFQGTGGNAMVEQVTVEGGTCNIHSG